MQAKLDIDLESKCLRILATVKSRGANKLSIGWEGYNYTKIHGTERVDLLKEEST